MDFRDTLSALLPSPRDDEPAGLRQDILDELGDHLACAYQREVLRGLDSNRSQQHVLERFGDPAAVARRLWLDAMRGKIMAQRVLIATCFVVMLACVTSVGLAWHWMNQDQLIRSRAAAEAIEANRTMSEVLAQSQSTNKEMLKQMRDMFEAVRHPSSPDWNPVTFRLTEETADGPPAGGFALTLTPLAGNMPGMRMGDTGGMGDGPMAVSLTSSSRRHLRMVLPPSLIPLGAIGQFGGMGGMGGMGQGTAKSIYRMSDSSGVADFGAVQPGDYSFRITKNWTEGSIGTAGQLNVRPGTQVQKSIVCPRTPPAHVTVRVRCAWPADLEKSQLVLYAPFAFRYRKLETGVEWSLADKLYPERQRRRSNPGIMMYQSGGQPAVRSVLCGPGTAVAEILKFKGLFVWTARGYLAQLAAEDGESGPGGRARVRRAFRGPVQGEAVERVGPGYWADLLMEDLREVRLPSESPKPRELDWETGTYGLDELIVLRPSRSENGATGTRHFDVLVASNASGSWYPIPINGGPPERKELETVNQKMTGGGFGRQFPFGGMQGGNDQSQEVAPTLELPTDYWDQVDLAFEARRGQVNEWTIPLPDKLIRAVREALKVDPTAKAKTAAPAVPAEDKK